MMRPYCTPVTCGMKQRSKLRRSLKITFAVFNGGFATLAKDPSTLGVFLAEIKLWFMGVQSATL